MKQVTYFDDIDSPEFVTRHFSSKEIRRVKMVAFIGLILFIHGIAYYIFRSIWPEIFGQQAIETACIQPIRFSLRSQIG
jgi:hypothetical protein